MSPFVKKSLHWFGSILAILGVAFVVMRFADYSSQLDVAHFNYFTWAVIVAFSFVYGMANIALALAWWNLLIFFKANTQQSWAITTYGLTQLAKYVPGNIMHLASRQALGLAAGVKKWPLAKATLWELILISIVGAFFVILTLPQFLPIISVPIASVSFACTLLIITAVLKQYLSVNIARAFGWYIAFLSISGMLFVGLLALFLTESSISVSQALIYCGAFIVAWLVGFITPGAPAGIGVRELTLMIILKGQINDADLLLTILMSRIVTVAGDLIFFLFASFNSSNKLSFNHK